MRKSCLFASACFCLFSILTFPSTAAETEEDISIRNTCASGPGMDAVLVIDVSGSMKQSDPDCLCKKAALDFVEELSFSPSSSAALITFSDTLQKVIPLTGLDSFSEDNEIVKELNCLEYTSGDTDIGTALLKAASLLSDSNDTRSKSIFLLTDGEIDLPAAEDEEAAEKESLTRALMAVEEAKTQGIVIHTVALDLSGTMDKNLMNYAADSTGGTSSLISSASDLDDVFQRLSEYAAAQAAEAIETEEELTKMQTEEETETESETQLPPAVVTIGSIDGPVCLKGHFPNLCTAKLKLSDLFRLEGSSPGDTDSILYTAYPDDNTLLSCTVEGDLLMLSGLKNGTSTVHVFAQPACGSSWSDPAAPDIPGYTVSGSGQSVPAPEESLAEISFPVEIDALIPVIPSKWLLLAIPALLVPGVLLVFFLRNKEPSAVRLQGSLQWYVRAENEKIFGIPSQTMADLDDYGNKVKLSELIEDDLLSGAALDKVVISGKEDGIVITSRSRFCMAARSGEEPQRRLEITQSGRFKVFCDCGSRRACVIASYISAEEYRKEPSFEDDSDERTRLLV